VNLTFFRPGRFIPFVAIVLTATLPSLRADNFDPSAPDKTRDKDSDQLVRLEEVEVSEPRTSALVSAPTDSKLDARQPQSILSLQYISNNVVPTADYATIANLAPSVANVETNGPGLSEAKHTTIRGIDDGGYNVTFDGIPFGDYNTFTHHTTSYFPAKLLGQVVVDRGPGTASTIGNATFGGTMALYSKDPRTELSFLPTLS
jgi:iron complex outermembrane recepter protein